MQWTGAESQVRLASRQLDGHTVSKGSRSTELSPGPNAQSLARDLEPSTASQ